MGALLGGGTGTPDSSTTSATGELAMSTIGLLGGRLGSNRKARLTSSSSSSIGAGDVGDGNSVGTGISVGDDGAVARVFRVRVGCVPLVWVVGTTVGTNVCSV